MDATVNGRYHLVELIGSGGMADVYRADDVRLERPVAIKLLRGDPAAPVGGREQPRLERRFAAEVAALSRLSHPGIVRLFDGGSADGRPYLVMELVEGRTLADIVADGALPPDAVRRIGLHVAEALAHAHAAGLVHRDVKPANVLVPDSDAAGAARLADFGIARLADATMSATAASLGTAAYLAPEQVAGGHVGPAADVYSLGLVLLECLTGERAFHGTLAEVALARLGRDPAIPDELQPGWAALLRAMTAREPADRPSAAAVAAALASHEQLARRAFAATTARARTEALTATQARVAVACAAALLLSAAGMFAASHGSEEAAASPPAVTAMDAAMIESGPLGTVHPAVDDLEQRLPPVLRPAAGAAEWSTAAPVPPAVQPVQPPPAIDGQPDKERGSPPDHAAAHGRRAGRGN